MGEYYAEIVLNLGNVYGVKIDDSWENIIKKLENTVLHGGTSCQELCKPAQFIRIKNLFVKLEFVAIVDSVRNSRENCC